MSPSVSPSAPSTRHHLLRDSSSLFWWNLCSRPFCTSPPTSLYVPGHWKSLTDSDRSYLLMVPGTQSSTRLTVVMLSLQLDTAVLSECMSNRMNGIRLPLSPTLSGTCLSSCLDCHAVPTCPHQSESFVIGPYFLFVFISLWALWLSVCVCVCVCVSERERETERETERQRQRLGETGRERKLEGVPLFSSGCSVFFKIRCCYR